MFDLKDLNLQKAKLILLVLATQLLTFGVGLYSGHNLWPSTESESFDITNYTTKTTPLPQKTTQTEVVNNTETNCIIKGNISSSNKIYHISGGAFYERTTAEMCFDTEEEALAAGFTKSSR